MSIHNFTLASIQSSYTSEVFASATCSGLGAGSAASSDFGKASFDDIEAAKSRLASGCLKKPLWKKVLNMK